MCRLLKEHDTGKSRMWDTVGSFARVRMVPVVVKEAADVNRITVAETAEILPHPGTILTPAKLPAETHLLILPAACIMTSQTIWP